VIHYFFQETLSLFDVVLPEDQAEGRATDISVVFGNTDDPDLIISTFASFLCFFSFDIHHFEPSQSEERLADCRLVARREKVLFSRILFLMLSLLLLVARYQSSLSL